MWILGLPLESFHARNLTTSLGDGAETGDVEGEDKRLQLQVQGTLLSLIWFGSSSRREEIRRSMAGKLM